MNEAKFRLWSNEHRAWWRPYRNGYTEDIREAGQYTESEALEICLNASYGGELNKAECMVIVRGDE